MHVTKWKQRRFPYNPNKPKIMRFASSVQPHARVKVKCGEYVSKRTGKVTEQYTTVPCDCSACQKARDITGHPAHKAHDKETDVYFWEPCDCLKCKPNPSVNFFRVNKLPEHVHVRRRLHQTLSRFNLS